MEYLAARTICRLASSGPQHVVEVLNSRDFLTEIGVVVFCGEQLASHSGAMEALLEIVQLSKQQSTPTRAAANAMSILNSARVSFSGMDLSQVKIAGADLRAALLHRTSLKVNNRQLVADQ